MPKTDPPATAPPDDEVQLATVGTAASDVVPLEEVDLEALTDALRYLQQRIPGLVQLSLRERQSMANAANLDPAIIDRGIELGAAWPGMKKVVGWSAEELRAEREKVRQGEELRRVLLALADTVGATTMKQKHRIGSVILKIYAIVGTALRDPGSALAYLRPYYEEMKRVILSVRKKKSRKAAKDQE